MAAAAIATSAANAQLTPGEKSLGPKLGYISRNNSAVAGLVFQYALTPMVRISPEIGCAFRHRNSDALLVDVNVHVPFAIGGPKVDLYPLAGLAFNSWSHHGFNPADDVDVTTHTNRLGLNLGAGFDLRCSSTLKLNLEAKYTLVKSYSTAFVTAAISYIF